MTVYTDETLTEFYEDDDFVSDFTGTDTGETVIIAGSFEIEPVPPVPFFGYPTLLLWQ